MSWLSSKISKTHRDIYSKAFNALYEDAKSASSSLLETTGTLLSTGYEKVKDGVVYLDKKYHDPDSDLNTNDMNTSDISDLNTSDISDYDTSDSDIYYEKEPVDLMEQHTIYPDILVKLNKKHRNLSKIWILEDSNTKTLVKGPIAGYPYVNTIIHKWFEYDPCRCFSAEIHTLKSQQPLVHCADLR